MKYFRCIILALFFCSSIIFSQEENSKHRIVKGETISSIAEKYKVSVGSIYKLNPKAKNTLQLNQVLLIPNSESKKNKNTGDTDKFVQFNHEVLPKETLYGITKQYKTTIELLYKANPKLEAEGLKIGKKIIIPESGLTSEEIRSLSQLKTVTPVDETNPFIHTVKPKESLYAIAKQYGVSFKELKAANLKLAEKGLSIGQEIIIPNNEKSTVISETLRTKKNQSDVVNKQINTLEEEESLPVVRENIMTKTITQKEETEVVHTVLPKETKYGIAKQYGITVAILEKQNPTIEKKLLIGSKLLIRVPNVSNDSMGNEKVIDTKNTEINTSISSQNEARINQLIATATENIGIKYRNGGTTNAGFDCSGLMYSTFGAFDIKLPRSSIEQAATGEKIEIENVQKGDLVFFKTRGRSHINHVGMVVEVVDDEIKFIHSSSHDGVIISSTKEPYYGKHFAQANRVIK